jgi:hypothetical protein
VIPLPAPLCQHIVIIDKEWAASLVGLPMLVPNSWWQGYKRDNETLNPGTIVGVNFNAAHSKYFQLKCAGKIYAMRYDAVYLYAYTDHANYDVMKFHLPGLAIANQANEEGVTVHRKRKSVWREKENEEENADNDYFATPKPRNKPAGKRKHKKQKQQSTLI